MNGSTAKLLRKYSSLSGHRYRDLKRIYKTYPGHRRFQLKEDIRADIKRLQKLKERNAAKAESEFNQVKQKSVVPNHSRPTANELNSNPSLEQNSHWWWEFWEWLKIKLRPVTSLIAL